MPYGNNAKASLNGWGRRPTSAPRQAEPPCKRASTLGRRPCCSRQRLGPLPTATRQRLYPANPGRLPCCSPMVNGWGRLPAATRKRLSPASHVYTSEKRCTKCKNFDRSLSVDPGTCTSSAARLRTGRPNGTQCRVRETALRFGAGRDCWLSCFQRARSEPNRQSVFKTTRKIENRSLARTAGSRFDKT